MQSGAGLISKNSIKNWEIPEVNIHSEFIDLNDVSLKLIRFSPQKESSNPALVFIAGWVTQVETWREALSGLSPDYPIYYLETREKVSSQMPKDARYGVQDIADDIATLIEKLDMKSKSYILMGSSLGATAIVEACQLLKPKPVSLILINPNAEFRVPTIWKIIVTLFYPPLYFLLLPAVKWYLRKYRLNVKADPKQYSKYARALDDADPRKLKKAVSALSGYSIWNSLKYVTCPTLIIGASEDKLHEPRHLQRMANELGDVKVVDLETNKAAHGQALIELVYKYLNQ